MDLPGCARLNVAAILVGYGNSYRVSAPAGSGDTTSSQTAPAMPDATGTPDPAAGSQPSGEADRRPSRRQQSSRPAGTGPHRQSAAAAVSIQATPRIWAWPRPSCIRSEEVNDESDITSQHAFLSSEDVEGNTGVRP